MESYPGKDNLQCFDQDYPHVLRYQMVIVQPAFQTTKLQLPTSLHLNLIKITTVNTEYISERIKYVY